jgi:hypothetical protein
MATKVSRKMKKQIGPGEGIETELSSITNQLLGIGLPNMDFAYPRYIRIYTYCESLIQLFEAVAGSPYMKMNKEAVGHAKEIKTFCENCRNELGTLLHLEDEGLSKNTLSTSVITTFKVTYDKLKSSQMVNAFIIMCNRLIPDRDSIGDETKLCHKFIFSLPGIEFCPFPFTSLNLKIVLSYPNLDNNIFEFFLLVLHKAYILSYKLYQEKQAPDIDISKFASLLVDAMKGLKKVPELQRCNKAFSRIEQSVLMLQTNFNEYYKDFLETGDSTIIMQNFISDLMKDGKGDAELTREFRVILMFYQKTSRNTQCNGTDKERQMLEKVNKSINMFNSMTQNVASVKIQDPC